MKTKDWPYAVIDFYLGRRSLDEMGTTAANANDKCESAFYVGEWQLLRGNKAESKASVNAGIKMHRLAGVKMHHGPDATTAVFSGTGKPGA